MKPMFELMHFERESALVIARKSDGKEIKRTHLPSNWSALRSSEKKASVIAFIGKINVDDVDLVLWRIQVDEADEKKLAAFDSQPIMKIIESMPIDPIISEEKMQIEHYIDFSAFGEDDGSSTFAEMTVFTTVSGKKLCSTLATIYTPNVIGGRFGKGFKVECLRFCVSVFAGDYRVNAENLKTAIRVSEDELFLTQFWGL